jgi:WhiB family redox-sensing transcriptional regulator
MPSETVTCSGQYAGPGSVLTSTAATLPVVALVLALCALPERLVMPSSQFSDRFSGWMPRSACRGEDPELFFPIAAVGAALQQVITAKAVCFRCAVRAACLSYALVTGQAGIWGGTTQEERHAMRRSAGFPGREYSAGTGAARGATEHHNSLAGQ